MSTQVAKRKEDQFIAEMIRCRGIEFARLGMMVECDGDAGTIIDINSSSNLNVRFTNQLKYGKHAHNCHPTWKMKYFGPDGVLIAHFDDNGCVTRPTLTVA